MKKIVISQPRYLPIMTYLQRLFFADIFVFLDNVQRQSRGWENRNKILIGGEVKWLTIPITSSSREIIRKTKIANDSWVESHLDTIKFAYVKHPNYDKKIAEFYFENVKNIIRESKFDFSTVIIQLITNACKLFGFEPKFIRASKLLPNNFVTGPKLLIEICKKIGTGIYISGKNGPEYGIIEEFKNSGIDVAIHNQEFPYYSQHGRKSFISHLSFFDPLFNLGFQKVKEWISTEPQLEKA